MYEIPVSAQSRDTVDHLVETFAALWLRASDPAVGNAVVADPILVLGPSGTTVVPRATFLGAIAQRASAVDDLAQATTTLVDCTSVPLGDPIVLATIRWMFRRGDSARELVSDFLLEREDDGLRCVAYLPRTNVMDDLT